MPKQRMVLSALSHLETNYSNLLTLCVETLAKISVVRKKFRQLRVDMKAGNTTEPEWLTELDTEADAAWGACRSLHQAVSGVTQHPHLAIQFIDLVLRAKEVVQADNACIIGRSGCEQRWDKAMDALKEALDYVRTEA